MLQICYGIVCNLCAFDLFGFHIGKDTAVFGPQSLRCRNSLYLSIILRGLS